MKGHKGPDQDALEPAGKDSEPDTGKGQDGGERKALTKANVPS